MGEAQRDSSGAYPDLPDRKRIRSLAQWVTAFGLTRKRPGGCRLVWLLSLTGPDPPFGPCRRLHAVRLPVMPWESAAGLVGGGSAIGATLDLPDRNHIALYGAAP
jgi:hypothetical protein